MRAVIDGYLSHHQTDNSTIFTYNTQILTWRIKRNDQRNRSLSRMGLENLCLSIRSDPLPVTLSPSCGEPRYNSYLNDRNSTSSGFSFYSDFELSVIPRACLHNPTQIGRYLQPIQSIFNLWSQMTFFGKWN